MRPVRPPEQRPDRRFFLFWLSCFPCFMGRLFVLYAEYYFVCKIQYQAEMWPVKKNNRSCPLAPLHFHITVEEALLFVGEINRQVA